MQYEQGVQYVVTETMEQHQQRIADENAQNGKGFLLLFVIGVMVLIFLKLSGALQ